MTSSATELFPLFLKDVKTVYKRGYRSYTSPSVYPALAELAEHLDPEPPREGTHAERTQGVFEDAIKDLLRRIAEMSSVSLPATAGLDVSPRRIEEALQELLGVGSIKPFSKGDRAFPTIFERANRAGFLLVQHPNGYEWLRHARFNKEKLKDIIRRDLAEQLVGFAVEQSFTFTGRFTLPQIQQRQAAQRLAREKSKTKRAS